MPLPHFNELHFHVPNYYLYAIPLAIIIGLIFLTYFGVRFGVESRKRTEALNRLELVLAKEHELESIGLQAAAAAHRQVTGQEAEYVGLRIVGDANLYVHGCGVPTFYYGPSNETAHANVEWVSVDRMASAAAVYALTAMNYCG